MEERRLIIWLRMNVNKASKLILGLGYMNIKQEILNDERS